MVLPCLRFRFPLHDNSTELRGDVEIPTVQPQKTAGKYLWAGVEIMRQVTKSNSHQPLQVSDYYAMYRQRAKSLL